ncbi:hypothetical protein BXZ70DRAFT_566203 [Cristinia sonorae]|uniref:Uncharacterized protein n=1 Tax=Cristinia sonorae TaxID=1940300 RepID=A0A8K0UGM2_9AGAR|nr:hypothetical protein BXZ70DRAFT_566203 [Cristinia sonorae]
MKYPLMQRLEGPPCAPIGLVLRARPLRAIMRMTFYHKKRRRLQRRRPATLKDYDAQTRKDREVQMITLMNKKTFPLHRNAVRLRTQHWLPVPASWQTNTTLLTMLTLPPNTLLMKHQRPQVLARHRLAHAQRSTKGNGRWKSQSQTRRRMSKLTPHQRSNCLQLPLVPRKRERKSTTMTMTLIRLPHLRSASQESPHYPIFSKRTKKTSQARRPLPVELPQPRRPSFQHERPRSGLDWLRLVMIHRRRNLPHGPVIHRRTTPTTKLLQRSSGNHPTLQSPLSLLQDARSLLSHWMTTPRMRQTQNPNLSRLLSLRRRPKKQLFRTSLRRSLSNPIPPPLLLKRKHRNLLPRAWSNHHLGCRRRTASQGRAKVVNQSPECRCFLPLSLLRVTTTPLTFFLNHSPLELISR